MTQWKTWAYATALGFTALSKWQLETAATRWIEAWIAVRNDKEIGNPCFASAQNNAGVGYAVCATREEAGRAFADAIAAWDAVARRAGQEDVDFAGGSSIHHLRLASRHSAQFAKLLRREYERLACAAGAMSRINAARLGTSGGADNVASHDVAMVIEAFGAESFEARLGRARSASPLESEHPSAWEKAGWEEQAQRASARAAAFGSGMSYWRRLETAVDMTALMPSGLGLDGGSAKTLAWRSHD